MVWKDGVKDVFSYRSFVHAVSGATGGFVAMSTFFPLDTARTILQVDDKSREKSTRQVILELVQKEGVGGLYRGWLPVITSLWCSNFVYFYSYNLLKISLFDTLRPSTPLRDLTAATIAGIINVLATTPMWVMNTRLKLQSRKTDGQSKHYSGMIDCFRSILRNEGVAAFWSGTVPSLVLVCNPTIQFVVYEALKRRVKALLYKNSEIATFVLFLIGAAAKAIATMITYPVQVIQTRLRARGKYSEQKLTIKQCMQEVYRNGGWSGFYSGITAKLLQTILMAALMFATYEKITATVFKTMGALQKS